jgi:hypothetical protein
MKCHPRRKNMKTFFTVAAALAFAVPVAARAADGSNAANDTSISCLTYLSQFEGAVPYYAGAPRIEEAQALAAKGRTLCVAGDEVGAKAYLTVALREIGVTPAGMPPGIAVQEAERPLPGPVAR